MGDLELSLDDIIKKKLGKGSVNRNRNNGIVNKKPIRRLSDQGNRAIKIGNVKPFAKTRGGISKDVRGPAAQVNAGDARLKIIQKQRLKITDAREKLGQIAKQTDARLRLMKLRERRGSVQGFASRGNMPVEPMLQRTIRPNVPFEDELMDFSNDISYMTRSFPERSHPENETFNYQFRSRQDLPVIYRTVENDAPLNRLHSQEQNPYSWKASHASPIDVDELPDIPVIRGEGRILHSAGFRNEERLCESPIWDYDEPPIVITKRIKPIETVGILKRSSVGSFHEREAVRIIKESPPPDVKGRGPAKTLSERFCQDGNTAQKISLLRTRLESSDKTSNDKDQEPIGHRIVVSNLVPSVTHEDVRELFEDIGELLSSKVVRPGTAEVVYKLHKDAVKAVDVYHNRQLDGQPMKCLLVNNRSLPISSKASKMPERKSGKGIVELDMTAFRKALHKKSTT